MRREQEQIILRDLEKKMVFISGPRQVGKTWLAQKIATHFKHSTYLNYDRLTDRDIINREAWLEETELLILDELHKMPQWKNYLKGVYDTKPSHLKILVTGSARLDTFRQAGDSLAGRYFIQHLLPFSLSELKETPYDGDLNRLIERSGFPEPFLAETDSDAKRWRLQYHDSLIREDILDFENVHNLKAIQLVLKLLKSRIDSPISYTAIAKDVNISPTTVKRYIEILEALYIVFRITPHSKNIARSLLKEPKIYFFDAGMIQDNPGIAFENTVAVSLLKHVYKLRDNLGENYSLHYLRTKENKKVDFAIVKENEIENIIECKLTDNKPSSSLIYFQTKYQLKATQLIKNLKQEHTYSNIAMRNAVHFLQDLE